MIQVRNTAILILGLLTAACGSGEEKEGSAPQAPKNAPMALDPNPPMSSQDIDNIVNAKVRGKGVAPPQANTGNTSDENKGN